MRSAFTEGECCVPLSSLATFAERPTPWGDWSQIMATAAIGSSCAGIRHVLIATDCSHQSNDVVDYGLAFARLFEAHVEIAYVLPTEEYALAGPDGMGAGRDAARRDLRALRYRLREHSHYNDDTDQQVTLLEGPVAECLMKRGSEKMADLIVVGTHGRAGLEKILLGSVAEKVFRHSTIPVLTIGPNVRDWHIRAGLREILAPCDLLPKSQASVRYACALATAQNANLTVLHVVDTPSEGPRIDPDRIQPGILVRLTDLVGRTAEKLEARYLIEFGKIVPAILEVARKIPAELIVLGVRPSSGILDRLQWPVASELVREATCPVLTLRESAATR